MRSRLSRLLLHEDEALLGPPVPRGKWNPKVVGKTRPVVKGAPAAGHLEKNPKKSWQRKANKLRRDPKKFFEDSKVAPLRVIGRLL